MVFYGVVGADGKSVIEFFATRERAETFVAEVDSDEPEGRRRFQRDSPNSRGGGEGCPGPLT
jgi:hypothetical protein